MGPWETLQRRDLLNPLGIMKGQEQVRREKSDLGRQFQELNRFLGLGRWPPDFYTEQHIEARINSSFKLKINLCKLVQSCNCESWLLDFQQMVTQYAVA